MGTLNSLCPNRRQIERPASTGELSPVAVSQGPLIRVGGPRAIRAPAMRFIQSTSSAIAAGLPRVRRILNNGQGANSSALSFPDLVPRGKGMSTSENSVCRLPPAPMGERRGT